MIISPIEEFSNAIRNKELDINNYYVKLNDNLIDINNHYNFFSNLLEPKLENTYSNQSLSYFPYSAKDNICTEGIETRAGSNILNGYIPPYNATVIKKINNKGGILIGKTCMDEFGFGTFNTNSAHGIPKNPFDKTRSCGGSSGGAAGITSLLKYHFALGVSTGGSISCPASFCGVIGLTPTYGRVSRYGLIDYANSLDKIGVLSRSIYDIECVMSIISGQDILDPTSINNQHSNNNELKIKKIGIPKELIEGVEPSILKIFYEGLDKFKNHGIVYEQISIPQLKYSVPAYYIIASAEASTNLAKFCGLRYGVQSDEYYKKFNEYFTDLRNRSFGEEAKRRILLGTYVRMAGFRDQYYLKALKLRQIIINEFRKNFKTYDLIASPSMPIIAPKFNEIANLEPISIYMLDFLTIPPNIAGLPHLSLPCGYINKLPVGFQFIANHWDETKLIQIGKKWDEMFIPNYPNTYGEMK